MGSSCRAPTWMAVVLYVALAAIVGFGVVATWGSGGLIRTPAAVSEAAPAAQGGTWVPLAPMGEARQEVGVAEVGGQVYVVGGFRGDTAPTGTAEAYDIASDTWRFVAPLPEDLTSGTADQHWFYPSEPVLRRQA